MIDRSQLPLNVLEILETWNEDSDTKYMELLKLKYALNRIGWTIEFSWKAEPYNIREFTTLEMLDRLADTLEGMNILVDKVCKN